MYFDDDNNSNIFNFDNFNDFNNNNLTSDVSNNYNASSENCGNICEVEGTEYYTNDCNYGLPYEDNTGEPTNFDTNIYYPPPPPPPPQQQQFVPCNVNPYVQQNINWNYPYACSSYLMNNTTNFMNLGMMTQAKNIEGNRNNFCSKTIKAQQGRMWPDKRGWGDFEEEDKGNTYEYSKEEEEGEEENGDVDDDDNNTTKETRTKGTQEHPSQPIVPSNFSYQTTMIFTL